jgi:hypothetical protein
MAISMGRVAGNSDHPEIEKQLSISAQGFHPSGSIAWSLCSDPTLINKKER